MSPGDRRDGNLCSLGGHGDGRELTGGFTQRYLRQFGLCGHLWDSKAETECVDQAIGPAIPSARGKEMQERRGEGGGAGWGEVWRFRCLGSWSVVRLERTC